MAYIHQEHKYYLNSQMVHFHDANYNIKIIVFILLIHFSILIKILYYLHYNLILNNHLNYFQQL